MKSKENKKKKITKIKELPSKIKDVKEISKKSKLEKEISESEDSEFSEFVSTGSSHIPVLHTGQIQQARTRERQNSASETPPSEFSYSGRSYESVVLPQENAPRIEGTGRNALQSKNISEEIRREKQLSEKSARDNYKTSEKGRRRYPWEV
jgi:hypothetical protein